MSPNAPVPLTPPPAPDPTAGAHASWWDAPTLTGRLVRLEPLRPEHAEGYLAALGEGADRDEVYRWLTVPPPGSAAEALAQIAQAREQPGRVPFAQLDALTGEVIGTTSLYEVDPAARSLAIGHTWLGRRWWRTGRNTESKLLLLTRAFEELGAVRVVWHVDERNARSRAAVTRLGAVQEGVLRKHKQRRDGSWRDTVLFSMIDDEWPAARASLIASLARSGDRTATAARAPS